LPSGNEAQSDGNPSHETRQTEAGDNKSPTTPARQPVVEERPGHQEQKRYFSKVENWVGILTLIFVAAYTVITFIQFGSNHRFNKKQVRAINVQLSEMRSTSTQADLTITTLKQQADTMQGQLRVMEADRRAWISLDTEVAAAASGPLIFDPQGAHLGLNFTFTNLGRSVARSVRLHLAMVPWRVGTPDSTHVITERDRVCTGPAAIGFGYGFILFPSNITRSSRTRS
jgi:hypothetical protein